MIFKTRRDFENMYENFSGLLLTFLEDTYYSDRHDKDTVTRFVELRESSQLQETIKQAKEILELKEFPYEFIGDISNRALSKMPGTKLEKYRKWVQWMVQELEKEGKKQNKLDDLQEMEKFANKYDHFSSLLAYLQEDTYYSEREDKDTLVRFIKEANQYQVMQAIKQAKEVLTLEKFPHKFIQQISNRYPFDKSHESTAEDYYNWLKWIVEELEKEAKNQGKL